MSSPRVFVVTGSNKGIGKSIVKLLLQDKEEKIVYLTSRNKEFGLNAVQELATLNLHAEYHQLDITDQSSIHCLRDHLLLKYGGLDVLVNNAGIAYSELSNAPFSEEAEVTITTNFLGMISVCDSLFPILKPNARVVNLSSLAGEFAYERLSDSRKEQFRDKNLSVDGLKKLLLLFVEHAKNDTLEENGWPRSAYGMSKVGVSILTQIQQREFDKNPELNIVVNSCHPGIVDTDMNGGRYFDMITPDEGADTPTYLALLPVTDRLVPMGSYHKLKNVVSYPPL
ncbi:carbonyl reductase [NADPH] 3 isoform X1 [Hydra vulgaris]|uniref:carbonyl reductase [NADPH] 3 isoform X1 n=1 Tax=Hydra vulgaris TaxID=6087 RepID=UPI000192599A|nr:carbonyl reductase [NADPH] 3 [Hydra vulgaris]